MNRQQPAHHMEGLCTTWMDNKHISDWIPGLKVYGSKNCSFKCLIQPSGGTQVHTVREGQEGRIALSYPPIVLSSYLQDLEDWQCEGQCQLSWGSSTSPSLMGFKWLMHWQLLGSLWPTLTGWGLPISQLQKSTQPDDIQPLPTLTHNRKLEIWYTSPLYVSTQISNMLWINFQHLQTNEQYTQAQAKQGSIFPDSLILCPQIPGPQLLRKLHLSHLLWWTQIGPVKRKYKGPGPLI